MNRHGRALLVAATFVAGGGAAVGWGVQVVTTAWPSPEAAAAAAPAERLVLLAAGLGLAAAGAWLSAATLVCARDVLLGHVGRSLGLLRPRALRRVMLMTCVPTVSAAAVCAGGQAAAETGDLHGLPLPERPVTHAGTEPGAAPESSRPDVPGAAGEQRTRPRREVLPGDCLWSIAADLLGPGASSGDVSSAWRAIYRDNRERVGADPDLLRPGTRLVVPPALHRPVPPIR